MNLVLSSDAKPRLKWTPELHQRFVGALNQLGGPEKATPKSLMRAMGVGGLTLYHLKSHLQKYRLGRSQQSQTSNQSQREDNEEENRTSHSTDKISSGAQEEINDLQVAQALQMQMDVQKKLHEQIEVQRHLQLRIEAQGKYLQSVLKKAQDTLSDYSCSSTEVEQVKAQLGQLVSMVNSGSSVLTESNNNDKELLGHKYGYSVESSLTSSDSSARKEEIASKNEDCSHKRKESPVVLSLMEMHPVRSSDNNIESDYRKRSKNGDSSNTFDLNSECLNEFDSGGIDLNCNGVELFSE